MNVKQRNVQGLPPVCGPLSGLQPSAGLAGQLSAPFAGDQVNNEHTIHG